MKNKVYTTTAMRRRRTLASLLVLLTMLLAPLSVHAYGDWDPKANDEAIVVSGNMRFTVLTPRMVRIQYSAGKAFEDNATFAIVNRKLDVPAFTTETKDGYLYIRTSALELRYLLGSMPNMNDGSTKNLQITFEMNGQTVTWYPGKDDTMNLLGTTRTLDRAWGDAQRNQLEKGLLSRAGWSVIDESPRTKRGDGSTTFALQDNKDGFPWWKEPVDKNATDWYFMAYGHDYKEALGDFTKVAGKVPMPPKYIFGYWYSRYWGYTQKEFQDIVTQAESYDLPMDVIIMDMDWHKSNLWTSWTWDKTKIPNPDVLINFFHKHGLKTALNLHPADGIASYEEGYSGMRSELGYRDGETIPWKLDDYDFYQSFFKNIMRPLEGQGIDFWWLDWQQWLTSPYTEGLSETFWLNHVYFTDMEKNRSAERPVIYHRWGGLGSHRYPICFSGDTYASWSTLAYEIPFTSMASNVCYTYWGHDLGGHQGGNNDPELMQRWLQFGVFTPIFRTHATNDSRLERRLWRYSNYKQLRETVRLRYRLFPYLYTSARETYDTGVGMNRPLYYDYPEQDNAYRFEDEYLFGSDILVAPLYTPSVDGKTTRRIWLPGSVGEGDRGAWWDVTRGELKEGGRVIEDSFTTDEFPYYYRAGAIIPHYPVQRTVQQTPETLILHVTPGSNGEGRFYEDNGENQQYRDNEFANTYFRQTRSEEGIRLTIEARQGSYPDMPTQRAWSVVFLGQKAQPTTVLLDGKELQPADYDYDAEKRQLTVNIAKGECTKAHTIEVMGGNDEEAVVAGQQEQFAENEPNNAEAVSGQLYITGSAVPEGIRMLEYHPDGTFKFHGHLKAGQLYIMNKNKESATTKYSKPKTTDASIITATTSCTEAYKTTGAAWNVPFESDHYRFTVNPASMTISGEVFTPWYECWIVGGCTGPGQGTSWDLSLGKQMVQNALDPDWWEWTGVLGVYAGNDQGNRMKISGQYDWEPKRLCPYYMDAPLVDATHVIYNNPNDNKWSISETGYYTVRVNPFREKIEAKFWGSELPTGIEPTPQTEDGATYFDLSGRKVTVPNNKGVYIKNGKKIIY